MELPDPYTSRAPTDEDLDAVAAVLRADDLDDAGQSVLGTDFVRARWSRAAFDLATDAWVVLDAAGTIVGYGEVSVDRPNVIGSWGVVDPAHRGRGIGSWLLDRIDARAVAMTPGPIRFRHSINADDRGAAGILRSRGLHPIQHFWHMEIDLVEPVEAGPSPAGIEIGGIDPDQDLAAVHAILVEAFRDETFRDEASHDPQPYDRWIDEETNTPNFDPTLWLLARADGEPVGALTASDGGDRGWVDYLGILATHRGRGIGAALLRRSFAAFAERGQRRVILNVDSENPTGATALYERVGMRVVKRWDMWERAAAPSA